MPPYFDEAELTPSDGREFTFPDMSLALSEEVSNTRIALALEAVGEGIAAGVHTRFQELKGKPWPTICEGVGSGLLGLFVGAVAHKPIGKFCLWTTGIVAGLDITNRITTTAANMADIYVSPDHFNRDKATIANTLGTAAFDYTVGGLFGVAGFMSGRGRGLAAQSETFTGRRLSARLEDTYAQVSLASDEDQVAIPLFEHSNVSAEKSTSGEKRVQKPTMLMEYRNRGLGRFYLTNRQPVVRVYGRGAANGEAGVGSGFFLDESGLLATNNHVVSGFPNLQVETLTGDKYFARVLARDTLADVAVLQVLNKPDSTSFPAFELAESGEQPLKSFAASIGHPEGVSQEVLSLGQVTNFGIATEDAWYPTTLINRTPRVGTIVSNLAIKGGFSGSPLLTDKGKVMGIITADSSSQTVATSVEHLRLLLKEIQSHPPSGTLDIKSVFDTNFGGGQAFTLARHDIPKWPIDGVAPQRFQRHMLLRRK